MPDQYAGKRVRCPACQATQRVPMPESVGVVAQPLADLSALDAADDGAAPVRRLRQVLIGCANCRKTIKVPESRFGRTMSCPSCGTLLKVDNFNLGKKRGDLIDLTHLELEPADPLADDDGFGSTVGGSSGSFGTAGGSTYALADPGGSRSGTPAGGGEATSGGGGGLGSANSQSQMRELRELNELKHSGAISNDEYRQRKAEIYAGKTLAIQAMSRSADGSGGNRPVLGRAESKPLLPKPVLALVAVAVLGGAGFALWATVLQPSSAPPAAPPPGPVAAAPETPETQDTPEPVIDEAPVEAAASAPAPETVEATPTAEAAPVEDTLPALPQTMMVGLDPVDDLQPVSGSVTPAGPIMAVGRWDVEFPDYTPTGDTAIAKACDVVKRIAVREDTALIGVAVGPPVSSRDDPAFRAFRQRMTDVFTDHAALNRQMGDLVLRDSEATASFGGIEMHRLHITSRRDRNARATILTGVQNGQAVSYWFAGHRRLYARFVGTVGRAQLVPIS
ncbi:MAG: SHOCT domain-containing protein [Planctomycetota bacterium]